MNVKWYRQTIEALGMRASRDRIINKLNEVYAQSDDQNLRNIVNILIEEILSTNANMKAMAPKEMKNAVPSAIRAINYCKPLAYPD